MSHIAESKLDQHVCDAGKGRLSVEKWSAYAPAGKSPDQMNWWLVEGQELGARKIFFCPYCGIKLDDSKP